MASPAVSTRAARCRASTMSPGSETTRVSRPTARSSSSPLRASTTSRQPRPERTRTSARPSPRDAPVTIPTGSVTRPRQARRRGGQRRRTRERSPRVLKSAPTSGASRDLGDRCARRGHTLVVEPDQRDHGLDVVVIPDRARRWALSLREDRMERDAALAFELEPELFRKDEVGGVIAVQVPDLPPVDRERELAPAPRARFDTVPRGDFFDDPPARGLRRAHPLPPPYRQPKVSLQVQVNLKSSPNRATVAGDGRPAHDRRGLAAKRRRLLGAPLLRAARPDRVGTA